MRTRSGRRGSRPNASRRSLSRRLALLFGLGALLAYGAVLVTFQVAKRSIVRALDESAEVAESATGPIEYAIEGAGPTVLVLPGTFGGYDQARMIGAELGDAGFRVLAVSRPGYLRTPIEVGRTPRQQADAVVALLDALGLDRVAVVAASGGGPSALELAASHPERTWGLVLVTALSGPKEQPPARLPPYTALTDRLFGEGFSTWWQLRSYERAGAKAIESPIFSAGSKHILAKSPAKLQRFFALAWFRFPPSLRWAGYLNDREQYARFAFGAFEAIRAPTLVVHGTDDRNAPIEHGDRAAARIPGAEYLRLEGGDHYVTIVTPELVWPRITGFLHRHAPAE